MSLDARCESSSGTSPLRALVDLVGQRGVLWNSLVLLLLGFVFTKSLQPGLDLERYVAWSKAVKEVDLTTLPASDQSPLGVPVFHWFAGTGLIIAMGEIAFGGLIPATAVALCLSFLFASVSCRILWRCFFELLEDPALALGMVAVTALATPWLYYARSISSESMSFLPALVLMHQTHRLWRGERINWWAVSGATAWLMMVRSYLGVFAWPVLLPAAWLEFQAVYERRIRVWVGVRNLALPVSMIGLALAQVFTVQYWMTGSMLSSPYNVGDDQFSALELSSPKYLGSVLFDPFHGVLSHHPLMGVGFVLACAAMFVAIRSGEWEKTSVAGLALFAVVFNVWVQGSFYCWFNGAFSFANRCVTLPAFVSVFAVAVLLSNSSLARRQRSRRIPVLLVLVVVWFACLWGWLHLLHGPSNYTDWPALLEALWGSLWDSFSIGSLAAAWFGMCVAYVSVRRSIETPWPYVVWCSTLVGMVAYYLQTRLDWSSENGFLMLAAVPLMTYVILQNTKVLRANQWGGFACFGIPLGMFAVFIPLLVGPGRNLRRVSPRPAIRVDAVPVVILELELFTTGRPDLQDQVDVLRAFLHRAGYPQPDVQPSIRNTYSLQRQWNQISWRYR